MSTEKANTVQLVEAFDESLIRCARRHGLAGSSALLAVSGGADSMALLTSFARIATRLSCRFEVATVDHGLRPESADDAKFVIAAAANAHVVRLQLAAGSGVEARARDARYAKLHQVRQKQGLTWLLTAHTASDQAETVMMRLMRGAALGGSASIQAARFDSVARPLLFATRADVETYLGALGVGWRNDSMNHDARFHRVAVRQSLMPVIEAMSPGSTRALARFATLAFEDDAHLNREAQSAHRRIRWPDGSLDRIGVLALERPIARRVMAAFLLEKGLEINADLIADTLAAAAAKHDATLPNEQVLRCDGEKLLVYPAPPRHIHGTSSSVHGRGENS